MIEKMQSGSQWNFSQRFARLGIPTEAGRDELDLPLAWFWGVADRTQKPCGFTGTMIDVLIGAEATIMHVDTCLDGEPVSLELREAPDGDAWAGHWLIENQSFIVKLYSLGLQPNLPELTGYLNPLDANLDLNQAGLRIDPRLLIGQKLVGMGEFESRLLPAAVHGRIISIAAWNGDWQINLASRIQHIEHGGADSHSLGNTNGRQAESRGVMKNITLYYRTADAHWVSLIDYSNGQAKLLIHCGP